MKNQLRIDDLLRLEESNVAVAVSIQAQFYVQMNRRRRRMIAIIFSALALTTLTQVDAQHQKAQERPNIVMIISDDQAWTDYSFMGHSVIKTPCLDELARRSVVFRNGYVPTALCRPSLMSIITGRYAHRHGITGNDPSPKYAAPGTRQYQERRSQLISYVDKIETLPKQLARNGYVCHQSGKWWEGSFSRGGFTHGMTRGFPEKGGRHGDDGLAIGRNGLGAVTDFMDKATKEEQPFFVWYAPFLPHTPHNPPKRFLERQLRINQPKSVAKYHAMCEWFDETCGTLVQHLDKLKIRENTIVVYVCDNGWIQDPNGRRYAPRSKQTPYQGGVRTPIMFSWPDKFKPNDRAELCSSLDLMPTLLSAVGIQPDADLPGLNLMPNLRTGQRIDRTTIFGESFAHDIADIKHPEASLLYLWCIESNWKLILTYDGEVNRYQTTHPRSERRPQLFNLDSDPHEMKNLASENPEVLARLVSKIEKWYPQRERKAMTTFSER